MLEPIDLRCEYIINPLGIDADKPRLSWKFNASQNDQIQAAYEILVSDNLADIKKQTGKAWSTGRVTSKQSTNIELAGTALESFTRYYWVVRVYNTAGELSGWSEPAWFETAMLQQADWLAQWIDDGRTIPVNDADAYSADGMPLFRKEFDANKTIASARLYISGLGYYEAYLNGKKISDNVLDPGWTTYSKEVLYVTHDISHLVNTGKNVVGIMLGNGWWNPLPIKFFGRWDLRDYQETGRPCVKAEIHVHYTDGSTDRILTDQTWRTTPGPIIQNSVYLGEHYDARREVPGWNTTGKISSKWKDASLAKGPSGRLYAQRQTPIKITKVIKPIKMLNPRPDTFVIDMGQNFSGVLRIKVKGSAGKKIVLRYGEDIFQDGTLNWSTSVMTQIREGGIVGGPGAPATAWQEDQYDTKGKGVEVWSPRFTFHGFRYIEVTGWPGKPTINDFEGLRMNSALEETGSFTCSNEMFNRIQEVVKWTFLSNVFSVQSDCPAREKMGYGADLVVVANAFIYNYDMANFYRKTVRDFANDQQADGGITEIAPFTGIADRGYGGNSGPLGWQLAFSFLQKQLYDFYGDKKIIQENYDGLIKQMNFLESKAVNGLFHWDIGDHEALDPRAEAFSAAAFYYHHALLATEFAGILEKPQDSIRFARLAQNTKRLIIAKYLIPQTGRFDNGTQSAQIFALYYDLSPEKELTFKTLMDEFARHNWHVSSGIFGVKMMFDVLRESDQNEVAYKIANQKDFPGWGYMLANGATTLWETWQYPELYPSQNHPMFGSISEWFYRSLLGINPGLPGFENIIIKPQPAGDLTWAKGQYESVRGTIHSEWKIEGGNFSLTVQIPGNTTADVWVPLKSEGKVVMNEKPVATVKIENGYGLIKIGSGTYTFVSERN